MLGEGPSRQRIIFDSEAEPLTDYLARQKETGLVSAYSIDAEKPLISCTLIQPHTALSFHLDVDCTDYRQLPPMFRFSVTPGALTSLPHDYPKQTSNPFGGGNLFILCGPNNSLGCVCSHFNRLAYNTHNGPHQDWGGPDNWLNAASTGGWVRATNLPEMFSAIISRFKLTKGRLSEP